MACDDDTDDNQFREDVISCEEAVAHLAECCPELRPSDVECRYYFRRDEGCLGPDSTTRIEPDIALRDSLCIRGLTCEGISSRGFCSYRRGAPDAGVAALVCR